VGLKLKAIANDFKSHVPKPKTDARILLLETASSTSNVAFAGIVTDLPLLQRKGLEDPLLTLMDTLGLSRLRVL